MKGRESHRKTSAFTFFELLVVLGLITLLVVLASPYVIAGRERSRIAAAENRLRVLAMSLAFVSRPILIWW